MAEEPEHRASLLADLILRGDRLSESVEHVSAAREDSHQRAWLTAQAQLWAESCTDYLDELPEFRSAFAENPSETVTELRSYLADRLAELRAMMGTLGTMHLPARCSFVTIHVRDLPRMAEFYRSLGWPESEQNNEHHVAFRTGGAVLGLYGAEHYEAELGPAPPPGANRGVTLAVNLENAEAVDSAYEFMQTVEGAKLLGEPQDLFFGGRGFAFADPEGNVWDVIWTAGTSFDDRGGLIFP